MTSLQDLIDAHPEAEPFRFGDNEKLCNEILALVRSGKKTATVEATRAYGKGGDAFPEVGRQDIALNWDGTPALMLETVSVETMRFGEMDEAKVSAQGEFRSLSHWRAGYEAYFARTGGFDPEMKIMFETFKVIRDFADNGS